MKQFELLKQRNTNHTVQGDAAERLKNIMEEAEKMKTQIDDKLRQIQGNTDTLNTTLTILG